MYSDYMNIHYPSGTLNLFLLGPIFFLPSPPMTTYHIWVACFVTHFLIPQFLNSCHLLFYDVPWTLRGKKGLPLIFCLRMKFIGRLFSVP